MGLSEFLLILGLCLVLGTVALIVRRNANAVSAKYNPHQDPGHVDLGPDTAHFDMEGN